MEKIEFKGLVKFFQELRGYGFITCDDGKEYFVHTTNVLEKPIKKDDLVTFELEEGKKGLKCVNVRKQKTINT